MAAGAEVIADEPGPTRHERPAAELEPETPLSGPFFAELSKRKANQRDAVILVTAEDADRGVGKTACATTLAKLADTTPDGFDAEEKATLSVPEFLHLYDNLEPGSALVLDEGEQLDSRRSMSQQNVDASLKMQTRRVNEVVVIITLPSPDMIDKRVEQLADFWVNVECRGKATIYKKKIHRIKRKVYYETVQTLHWPNLDGDEDYEALVDMKDQFIDEDATMGEWVRETEVQERIDRAVEKAEKRKRDELIRAFADRDDVLTKTVAEVVGLSSGRVSQIVKEAD